MVTSQPRAERHSSTLVPRQPPSRMFGCLDVKSPGLASLVSLRRVRVEGWPELCQG